MIKRKQTQAQSLLFDDVISNNTKYARIFNATTDVKKEVAAVTGTFVEEVLSEQGAIESTEIPAKHDSLKQLERLADDVKQRFTYLREVHRTLSEDILTANRELAQLAVKNRLDSEDAIGLRKRLKLLQDQRGNLDAAMEIKAKALKRTACNTKGSDQTDMAKGGLIRVRHPNQDFFLADLFDYALKDDGASMEAPIFTLATKPDLSIWQWTSKDGNKSIKVAPSVLGRATQFDKDVLIYVVSQLTEALNRGRDDTKNRTVRFTVYDYLVTTNRGVRGDDYQRLQEAFERLRGTSITTDITTGGERIKEGFGIIDSWRIIEKSREDDRMIAVEITLSRWLYNAVQAFEVLTIHPDYFRLRKPLARRLYEMARKHCGHQTSWAIGLELLRDKSGSKSALKEFRRMVRAIETDDSLPEYRVIVGNHDKVTFYVRDSAKLIRGISKQVSGG